MRWAELAGFFQVSDDLFDIASDRRLRPPPHLACAHLNAASRRRHISRPFAQISFR